MVRMGLGGNPFRVVLELESGEALVLRADLVDRTRAEALRDRILAAVRT